MGELLEILGLRAEEVDASLETHLDFPMRVPRGFVARMRSRDPSDPLLRQVLPVLAETAPAEGFSHDPLVEGSASPAPGLLHKYRGRVLLLVVGACAVHCRYCFRRHFPYADHQPWRDRWREALDYIARDSSIREVILSGGDPLSATDEKLARLVSDIAGVPHVERLRVHSRLPIVLPERIDEALLGWLGETRLKTAFVVHANHAREIDADVVAALGRLRSSGVILLNQTVLLRGINDDAKVLRELSEALFAAGVLPYYLNLLDRVSGTAHFEVDEKKAREIMAELLSQTAGYLVPRLVREVPEASSKTPIELHLG